MEKKDITAIVIAACIGAFVLFGIPFIAWVALVVKVNTPETPTTTETTVKVTPTVNNDKSQKTKALQS